jgi:hypothetical protein
MTVDNKFSSHLVPEQYHLQPDTWDRLKDAMHERFVPLAYQRDLRKKLQCLDKS